MAERRDTRRRFEQWARNPDCVANAISAIHGVPMAEVAKAEGFVPTTGQSPFAIARGQGFERALFRDDAKRMREALLRSGLLTDPDASFLDFRLRQAGGKASNLDEALVQTSSMFGDLAERVRSRRKIPAAIVAGATLRIPGGAMLPEAIVVLDVLLVRPDSRSLELVAGEIKTYPDRAGYTEAAEIATARAQLGTYVHGLELAVTEVCRDGELRPCLQGFLVLSRPGFNLQSIRSGEDLRYQVERARRGLARLREIAASTPIPEGGTPLEAIRAAPCSYTPACVSFCDRAPLCYERARADGRPVVLGDDVERFLGGVTVTRASELMTGATPNNDAEADVARRLDEIRRPLRPA